MSNPKADLHNINAHIKFGENPLRFTQVIFLKDNTDVLWADNSVKTRQNSTFSNPKADVYNINAHTKFGENPLIFSNVIIHNENIDVSGADNSIKN